MMRVYVPMTLSTLAKLHADRGLFAPPGGLEAHAVTGAVREWYVSGDLEEFEYAALVEAARASLRLLADDAGAPRRRVVVAADLPDLVVSPRAGAARSAVLVSIPLLMDVVVSVHVDEPEAEQAVTAAVAALDAADVGDDDAQFLLDEAEACDLLWYDVTEIPDLI
jgi:hypothetical protein